ncbi:class I SAM-dependent methyltransferase [Nostoc sp. NIES-2111]
MPITGFLRDSGKQFLLRSWDLLNKVYYWYNVLTSYRHARQAISTGDSAYDAYIKEQLLETLQKKRIFSHVRRGRVALIEQYAALEPVTGKSVLCVGCRNVNEIEIFRSLGASKVVGIDLQSSHPDILVMDMHDLKFEDSSFDVVYSRHSFEHAFDKRKAAGEFARVCREGGSVVIEVPGGFKGGADYNRFDTTEDVFGPFRPQVGDVIIDEYRRKADTGEKMDIIRAAFHVKKAADAPSA